MGEGATAAALRNAHEALQELFGRFIRDTDFTLEQMSRLVEADIAARIQAAYRAVKDQHMLPELQQDQLVRAIEQHQRRRPADDPPYTAAEAMDIIEYVTYILLGVSLRNAMADFSQVWDRLQASNARE
jgi:hypothetical protein